MSTQFTGKIDIEVKDWSDANLRPKYLTDIFIFNKIYQKIELVSWDFAQSALLTSRSELDLTKIYEIPEDIYQAKNEYPSYGEVDFNATVLAEDSSKVTLDLDVWKTILIKNPISSIVQIAINRAETDEVDLEDPITLKSAFVKFIGEMSVANQNIKLPFPIMDASGDIDITKTYSPFKTVTISGNILETFFTYYIVDRLEPVIAKQFMDEWIALKKNIAANPTDYISETAYLKTSKNSRIMNVLKQKSLGVNI